MHKAQRSGWDQTSRAWLEDRIRAAIPHAGSAEELLAYLEADGIPVKPRRGPSGDLLGYAIGRPDDLDADGEQIYYPGGKIAPDLTFPKLRARLETVQPEEHPTARRDQLSSPWHRAVDALDALHADMAEDTRAQAHITALAELMEATAQIAPVHLRAELRAAADAFTRAQRSRIRAKDQAAHALRAAARDIVNATAGPDGSALAGLIAALVWAAIVAERWHDAKQHAQQAEAARRSVQHLEAAADQALAPVLEELAPRRLSEPVTRALARDVRSAVPDEADRILADPAWSALAAVLAEAENRGHQPCRLLEEAAARRKLTTAPQPARVLITRIQHAGRNPVPNRRAEAARMRSTRVGADGTGVQGLPLPASRTGDLIPANRNRRPRR